tara:strand:+ start:2941 stop:3294 length:354 start_codon:yes stop_codon:yes gene_type:complete
VHKEINMEENKGFTLPPNPSHMEKYGKHICPDENGKLCPRCKAIRLDPSILDECINIVAAAAYKKCRDIDTEHFDEDGNHLGYGTREEAAAAAVAAADAELAKWAEPDYEWKKAEEE